MARNDELRELTKAWNDAWNSRDASKLAAFFTDSGTYYEPDLAEAVSGKTGIEGPAKRTWDDWPDVSFDIVSTTIEDPRVVLEWRSAAKHKSGKILNLEGVDVLEWDGDKISAARVYYDVHSRKVALGEA